MKRTHLCRVAFTLVTLCWLLSARWGVAQPQPMRVVSPEVGADRQVTFRILAPNAKEVTVSGEFTREPIAMSKGEDGVWSVTVGPLRPDIYGYGFRVDGQGMPDPSNTFARLGVLAHWSQVEVPGEEAAYQAIRDVPHGTLHDHWYYSKHLKTTRRVVIYTPPGYDASKTYPALYLLHGMGDDERFWVSVGRANFIMDNLLAGSKAKPALIVMPFGHASRDFRPPARPRSAEGERPSGPPPDRLFTVSMLETDLKENIIPLVEREYRVGRGPGDRAIIGMSMGGYQSLAIGLNNPSMFAYVGGIAAALIGPSFEPAVEPFLADPEKANKQLRLLWLGCGADDRLLETNEKFVAQLNAKGIKHEFVVTPGYGHWWTLCRIYLRDFLPKLFKSE